MGCYMPIRINAKKRIQREYNGVVDTVTAQNGYQIVPCGKCLGCKYRRVNDWALRLMNDVKPSTRE